MTEELRFAVIGCGGFGSRRINALQKIGAPLTCVVDTDEGVAKKYSQEVGCDYYTDYEEAVKRDDVDCVIIPTPNKFHAPISITALNNKKHVICEKPLARNPKEARNMVNAAKENRVFLKTGSNLRYFSNVKKAKELLDNKMIGDPLFIRGWIGHDGEKVLHKWNTDKEIAGGGTLLDNGAHILDLFRWFFGDFTECVGYTQTLQLPVKVEDNGVGLFKTADGKLAFVQSSWTEWSGYMYMEIYGSKGSITIDNRGERIETTGKWLITSKTIRTDKRGERQAFDYSNEPPQSYELELKDFIKSVKDGKQPMASGSDGMKVIEMVHGIYESSETGRIVKLT